MSHSIQEVCQRHADLIKASRNTQGTFASIRSAKNFDADSMVFVSEAAVLEGVEMPAVVVTSEEIAATLSDEACVVVVDDVRLAQALIKQSVQDYDASDPEWDPVHDSAVVHPSARLGEGVRIGPNSVVGRNVVIGDRSQVRANCVVEHDVVIGQDCIINNLVNLGYGTELGNRVILRPGVIIGNEGFGFAQNGEGHYQRVPHTGIVEIQDDVQIGSNCNIDRATYDRTIIARGVKIDALCHVGHNTLVDEDALFVAQCGISGSSKIGKRVILSGQTGMLDHRVIVDDVVVVHRGGVTEDILTPGMWAGKPVKPFKEYVRGLGTQKRIAKLEKKIADLTTLLTKAGAKEDKD